MVRYAVRPAGKLGEKLVALEFIPQGDTIMELEHPIIMALETNALKTHCYTCLEETKPGRRPKLCGGCRKVRFCDDICADWADNEFHRLECRFWRTLSASLQEPEARAVMRLLLLKNAGKVLEIHWRQMLKLHTNADPTDFHSKYVTAAEI